MPAINDTPLLSFIVPTKGRPEIVDEYLQIMLDTFLKYDVNLYIIDGNDDDFTCQVCNKYKSDKIFYVKMPDTGLKRIMHGIKISNSEYICLCGEKNIPIPEKTERIIELLKKGYDILEFTSRDLKNIGMKEYSSPKDMCIDCAWDATAFGSVFIKRASYKPVDYEEIYNKYSTNVLWYIPYYFDYVINNNSFRGLYVPEEINTSPKTKKIDSSWYNKEQFFQIWAVDWNNAINSISFLDKETKHKIILDHTIYGLHLATFGSWYVLKSVGILDSKICKQYKSEIKQMSPIDYKYIVLIAHVPLIFLRIASKISRLIKRALKIFKK